MVPGRHATPHGWGRGPRRAVARAAVAPGPRFTHREQPPAPPPPKRLLPVRCRDVLLRRSRGCRSCPVLASRYWSRVRRWRPARSSRMVPGRHATPHGWGRGPRRAVARAAVAPGPRFTHTSPPAPPPPKRLLPVRCRDVLLRRSRGCRSCPVLASRYWSRVRRWRPARSSRMVPGRHATPHGWGRGPRRAVARAAVAPGPRFTHTSAPAPPAPKRLLPVRCRDVLLRRSRGCRSCPVLAS